MELQIRKRTQKHLQYRTQILVMYSEDPFAIVVGSYFTLDRTKPKSKEIVAPKEVTAEVEEEASNDTEVFHQDGGGRNVDHDQFYVGDCIKYAEAFHSILATAGTVLVRCAWHQMTYWMQVPIRLVHISSLT